MLRAAIVGCGLIGSRRARVVRSCGDEVVAVADLNERRALELASELGCESAVDWREIVARHDVDVVVVSTFNSALADISVAALAAGKHVLCEKPFGRNAREAEAICVAANHARRKVKVGFNLRFHPAIRRAHELLSAGDIGRPLVIRGAYGHGGRRGYEHEWRADVAHAGGGELLDQGVHLIDLSRWFLGDLDVAGGTLATAAWPIAPLEDNAFALLVSAVGGVACLHSSWTQWRNLFRFELLGEGGYLAIDGLGGSYGEETLRIGQRDLFSAAPTERRLGFPGEDSSWVAEWREFVAAIREDREPLGSGHDGLAVAQIVDKIYAIAAKVPGGPSSSVGQPAAPAVQ